MMKKLLLFVILFGVSGYFSRLKGVEGRLRLVHTSVELNRASDD